MKNRIHFIAGALMLASLAGAGFTYGAGTQNQKESSPQDRRTSYLESLSKSKQAISAISTGVDALLKVVQSAKASDDKAKMKAALDASEKHLAGMKVHTESCMKHMETMEKEMAKDSHMGTTTAEHAP